MQTREADRWRTTRRTVQRDAEYIMKKRRVDGLWFDVTVFPYLCKPLLHFDESAGRALARINNSRTNII